MAKNNQSIGNGLGEWEIFLEIKGLRQGPGAFIPAPPHLQQKFIRRVVSQLSTSTLSTMLSFAVLALIPFVAAQSNPALEVAAIQAHFKQAGLVPDLLPTFEPSALMTVNFPEVGDIKPGQPITQAQSGPTPAISFTPANSSVKLDGNFTIFMVDADVAGTKPGNVNRHWLVNGVTVSDNKLSNSSATAITSYAGPGPAEGSGPHRYTIILYQQPADFVQPADFREPMGVTAMSLSTYVSDSKLGAVVAANYFTVEVGTSTVSVSSTSAVESSTLSAASATSNGSNGGSSSTGAAGSQSTGSGSNGAVSLNVGAAGSVLALLTTFFMLA
ncbi:hypothetical protein V5O48_003552 [Marasmius crinis-equi]|uniref:PEBP-like protein n=1 Tax=Marasmius crinis-equi TaxID=585013 RepID=A0ABR3FSK8_9AGAR